MEKWPAWSEWPGWLLMATYLICALLLMVLVEIVHLLIVKPIAARVASSARRAARGLAGLVAGLVAPPTAKRHYVMVAEPMRLNWTGELAVITGTANIQLAPLTASGSGTVTNPPSQIA